MKILITGGAGYKGVVLTKQLLDNGNEVTILDNFLYGYESVLHLVQNKNLTIIREDVRNLRESHLKDYDGIYHLGGISGYPACEANPHSAHLINVEATKTMANNLSNDQFIIYASTTSFYGDTGKVCTEEMAIKPVSLYGITKYHAEQYIMQRKNSVALRFATIFGISPKMRIDLLVNDFTYKAVNDRSIVLFESKSKRTFLHLLDAINAYTFTLDNLDKMRGQIYNVGSNDLNYSKLEIAEHIKKYTNCTIIDSDLSDFDVRNFEISFEKIASLGYKVTRTLDDGVQELIKLYKFYKPFLAYKTI
ncbi:MAG: SDR family oxidoreductase [Bacteroidetes bacterium]|nr:SDR family oxidoreductase [Bacteroidota bacterium]